MALISCKECGKEVSSKADSCPHCGKKLKRDNLGCGTVIALLFFIMIIYGVIQSAKDEPYKVATEPPKTEKGYEPNPETSRILGELSGERWKYSSSEDAMSGGVTWQAQIRSINQVEFGFPYSAPQRATLTLRTHPRWGKDVYITIERGQFLCSSYDGCEVLVRFGEGQATKYKASEPESYSSTTLFVRNYHAFVENMLKVDTVRISTNVYQEGSPIFEFNVKDFDVASYLPKDNKNTSVKIPPIKTQTAISPTQAREEIKAKIIKNWVKPAEITESKEAELEVVFITGGDVGKVRLIQGSGDRNFDMSLIAAVYDAAPFNLPSSETKSLIMKFINE